MISPSQRPLPDNTQHSQQTDIHVLARIRTRNPSIRAAADLSLRTRGYWDRLIKGLQVHKYLQIKQSFQLNIELKAVIIKQWQWHIQTYRNKKLPSVSLVKATVDCEVTFEEDVVSKMETVCVLCEVGTEFQYSLEMNWRYCKRN